jgi:hypothetical protein
MKVQWALAGGRFGGSIPYVLLLGTLVSLCLVSVAFDAEAQTLDSPLSPTLLLDRYCVRCHNSDDFAGQLALDTVDPNLPAVDAELWEGVIGKLRHRQMPPVGKKRPDEAAYDAMIAHLELAIDGAAGAHPQPGRTATFRRLTRTEYQNAIRDLLAIDVDATSLLSNDEPSHGFDNVTVGGLSPTHLERYITAARHISKLAVGASHSSARYDVVRIRPDVTQEEHVTGLPIGTRGGALIPYMFPQDGEYEIQVRLARDRNEEVEGLNGRHALEVLVDRESMAAFTIERSDEREDHSLVDAHLKTRISVTAGPHDLGVTFIKNSSSLLETARQPFEAHFNMHRHPRITPAVYQVSISGPFSPEGPGDTPSRARIFVNRPGDDLNEETCATEIVATLLRRAYRRPVTASDLEGPMAFYREGRAEGDFEAGIENALSAVLVSPEFLFRIEHEPEGAEAETAYRVSDIELASRLSFFLWSTIPDDELLDAAERGDLSRPQGLRAQVDRMIADPRARSLATNFAAQWLHLPKLESWSPDQRRIPDFDDNLRKAFRQETELFFESVLRENRSVLDLLKTDYTYLNERLAKHYGIPHVYGTRFRRVSLGENSHRGGVLRQGSVLTVTSYATRTSPVVRGMWVLDTILGTPPPPPPPDVPDLEDNTVSPDLPVRARLAEHRENPKCSSCHDVIDPIGLALENYDAVGRWRTVFEGTPIDVSGGLPDGSAFNGVAGLEDALLRRPELFAGAVTERLLVYALGRGVEYYDGPAIREVVRSAEPDGYSLSSLLLGIVKSVPFQMRMSS